MKKHLFTGFILLLPLILTLLVIRFLFDLFTAPFVPIVNAGLDALPYHLPDSVTVFVSRLIGLILLCILILVLGVIARHIFLNNLLRWMNLILSRIPFVKTVYKVSREVMTALFSPDGKEAFKKSVLIPFPYAPHYAVALTAGDVPKECEEKAGEPLVTVFAPTAPHPISGFLFLVPKKNIHNLNMTKEDAIKFLVSCGAIVPDTEKTLDHD